MPQKELADRLGKQLGEKPVTSATISRWYQGQGLPEPHRVPAIAAVLGVSKNWLAFGEGEMTAGESGLTAAEVRRKRGAQRRRGTTGGESEREAG